MKALSLTVKEVKNQLVAQLWIEAMGEKRESGPCNCVESIYWSIREVRFIVSAQRQILSVPKEKSHQALPVFMADISSEIRF